MKEIQHCNLCAWRGECQLKYKLINRSPSARFCNEFTRDVTLGDVPEEAISSLHASPSKAPSDKDKSSVFTERDYRKPRKRYVLLDDDTGSESSGEKKS